MFKIESITFNHGTETQEYKFTENTFIYGQNTVGKTALTKAIDFVLGSSEGLHYQGLDNIDSVEALLTNGNTNLWVKRSIVDEFFYRRTIDSEYTAVGADTFKNNICLILNENPNNRFLEIYEKVFDEKATFRSFSFLNFLEEKGLGDLSVVFTRAKELKHQIRIRNIMNFFFNFENIEQIYQIRLDLEQSEVEFSELNRTYTDYQSSVVTIKRLFSELQIRHTGDIVKDAESFKKFKVSFERNRTTSTPDLVYLTKASFSLAEEIKLYTYMQNQAKNMGERKTHTARLLSILNAIVEGNPEYSSYSSTISEMIQNIEDEKVILALSDYHASIKQIQLEKQKIDEQILRIRAQSSELDYDVALKKIGQLESCFSVVEKQIDIRRFRYLEDHIKELKSELKSLQSSFNKTNIRQFNSDLTGMYLFDNLHVKHVDEDRAEPDFSVDFDPFRLFLLTSRTNNNTQEYYLPGSMARQTHLQVMTYLCMFEYLKKHFSGFIYMPVLIIDSANQPMGIEIFKKVYPIIIECAQRIGMQTIFLSKDIVDGVEPTDFIDISEGLNKFHKQN